MNIFYLDEDPVKAAQYLCDKHVVKMGLETVQILSTALRLSGHNYEWLYKITHKNHPCIIWATNYRSARDWLIKHGLAIFDEYANRYGKEHKCLSILTRIDMSVIKERNPKLYWVNPPLCMPNQYKTKSAVMAYRDYYKNEKSKFAKWDHGPKPDWW